MSFARTCSGGSANSTGGKARPGTGNVFWRKPAPVHAPLAGLVAGSAAGAVVGLVLARRGRGGDGGASLLVARAGGVGVEVLGVPAGRLPVPGGRASIALVRAHL